MVSFDGQLEWSVLMVILKLEQLEFAKQFVILLQKNTANTVFFSRFTVVGALFILEIRLGIL
jgi:hypothetical protein